MVLCRAVQTAKRKLGTGLWEALFMSIVYESCHGSRSIIHKSSDRFRRTCLRGFIKIPIVRTTKREEAGFQELAIEIAMARNLTWTDEKKLSRTVLRQLWLDLCQLFHDREPGNFQRTARKAYRDKVRAEFQRHECAKHPRNRETH